MNPALLQVELKEKSLKKKMNAATASKNWYTAIHYIFTVDFRPAHNLCHKTLLQYLYNVTSNCVAECCSTPSTLKRIKPPNPASVY